MNREEQIKNYMDEYCKSCKGYKEHGCEECDIHSDKVTNMILERVDD